MGGGDAGRIRRHHHRGGGLALGQEGEHGVEHGHGPEEVDGRDHRGGLGLGPDPGTQHQPVEAPPGQLRHCGRGRGPSRRLRQIGLDLGVVDVDADHTNAAALEAAGDGRADARCRPRDGDGAPVPGGVGRSGLRAVHGGTL